MKTYLTMAIGLCLLLTPGITRAQDVNEGDLFSDPNTVQTVAPQKAPAQTVAPQVKNPQGTNEEDLFSDPNTVVGIETKKDEKISDIITQASTTFSGELIGKFEYDVTRDVFDGKTGLEEDPYATSMAGDFLLDVRLNKGIKAFGDVWASYSPQDQNNDPATKHFQNILKELFLDVNIGHKVYFRFGKQNLKWGRGYLWNPTDVISTDRKDFNDIDARLEGVYGLKTHIPFGTKYNLYGFLNASGANKTKDFSFAGKFEVLLPQNIEMAVSAWKKKGYHVVYGLDFATHKLDMDWRGEISTSYGDNQHRLEKQDTEFVDTQIEGKWVSRLSFGFTRFFDAGNYTDRIELTTEFYYNESGYANDMLADAETRATFLQGGYFESGNYGKYYAAVFFRYNKFLRSDLALLLNGIGNLSDSSGILSSGLEYQLANNATLDFKVNGYLGSKNREYTLAGNALSAEVRIYLAF